MNKIKMILLMITPVNKRHHIYKLLCDENGLIFDVDFLQSQIKEIISDNMRKHSCFADGTIVEMCAYTPTLIVIDDSKVYEINDYRKFNMTSIGNLALIAMSGIPASSTARRIYLDYIKKKRNTNLNR